MAQTQASVVCLPRHGLTTLLKYVMLRYNYILTYVISMCVSVTKSDYTFY